MKFYAIGMSLMDALSKVQINELSFNLELITNQLKEYSKGSKIYEFEVKEIG